MTEMNRIIVGDAVEEVQRLREAGERFNIIIADPPYNIGKDYGDFTNDSRPLGEYINWCMAWINPCRELLAENGLMYIYGLPEIISHMAVHFPLKEHRLLQWHYRNKAYPSSSFWQRSHETILCLWRPGLKAPQLEIDQIREPYTELYKRSHGRERPATSGSRYGEKITTRFDVHPRGALPRDVLYVPALSGGSGHTERYFLCRTCDNELLAPKAVKKHRGHDIFRHPTQKPKNLTNRLLKSAINLQEGGRLLVPFAGSGSECVQARELGVDFLGIEINPEYVDFARRWLAMTTEGTRELL